MNRDTRVRITDLVSFVENRRFPIDWDQEFCVCLEASVSGDQDMAITLHLFDNLLGCLSGTSQCIVKVAISLKLHIPFELFLSTSIEHASSRRMKNRHTQCWPPSMKFVHPLLHHSSRANHNNGLSELFRIMQTSDERNSLNCLAQAHLVAHNTTHILRVELP